MDMEIDSDPRFDLQRDQSRPLPDVLVDKIRELIDLGIYKPSQRLPAEADLTRRWKVARSSLRTALQRLETLGVLESRHGRGWFVRRRSPAGAGQSELVVRPGRYPTADLFEVRIALEGLAASLAALRASEGEVEDIAKLNMQHQEAGDDRDELLRTDQAFHEAIVKASRNAWLIAEYEQIVADLEEWRYQSYATPGVPRQSAREHTTVVRYLRNHDPGGARVAMNSHLQRSYYALADISGEPLDPSQSPSDPEPDWRVNARQS
jgi:GntR family transcriptional regulator, transcriptional repressor for pyruvate dehydrogenase complex